MKTTAAIIFISLLTIHTLFGPELVAESTITVPLQELEDAKTNHKIKPTYLEIFEAS